MLFHICPLSFMSKIFMIIIIITHVSFVHLTKTCSIFLTNNSDFFSKNYFPLWSLFFIQFFLILPFRYHPCEINQFSQTFFISQISLYINLSFSSPCKRILGSDTTLSNKMHTFYLIQKKMLLFLGSNIVLPQLS